MFRTCLFAVLAFGVSSALRASADTDLLALVPGNSKVVSSIDVARTRSSGFGLYMLTKMSNEDNGFKQFVAETGFDPRQDLQTVVFAGPGPSNNGKHESFVLLARGNFDEEKVRSAALKKGAEVKPFLGFDVIVSHPKRVNGTVFTFPSPGILLMGDNSSVRSVLQSHGTPSVLDADLQSEIDAVSSTNDAWFASTTGGNVFGRKFSLEANGQAQQPVQAFDSILRSSGGIRFGDLNQIQFAAVARSPKDAASLSDVVRFFGSMMQMERGKDPRAGILASSLDNMQLKTSGDTVNVSFSIGEKDLEKLAELGPPQQAVSVHPK